MIKIVFLILFGVPLKLFKMTEKRKRQYDIVYMNMAKVLSELSYCTKKKVGALLVKNNKIIANGFNGSPAKTFPNNCEDENNKTHWHTLHAESNVIMAVASSTQSSENSTMYVTCSPCKDCSKLIFQAGVKRVIYLEFYKDLDGVEFLKQAGIEVKSMNEIQNNFTDIVDSYETDYKSKMALYVHKTINKAHMENDYKSIDDSVPYLLNKYSDDIMLLRAFMLSTNSFKNELKNRERVFSKIIQVCENLHINVQPYIDLK